MRHRETEMSEELTKSRAGQYLTFTLAGQLYGVPIESVREINQMSEITEVPRTPEFVEGVMNLRGTVLPVVDLRKKFAVSVSEYTKNTCIVVIDVDFGPVGMIVDSVKDVAILSRPAPNGAQLAPSH